MDLISTFINYNCTQVLETCCRNYIFSAQITRIQILLELRAIFISQHGTDLFTSDMGRWPMLAKSFHNALVRSRCQADETVERSFPSRKFNSRSGISSRCDCISRSGISRSGNNMCIIRRCD